MNNLDALFRKAISYLTIRDRSEREVRDYLVKKCNTSGKDKDIDTVIEKLKQLNLLNDQSFAINYTNSQLKRGKGQIFIKLKLKYYGVDQDFIDQAITQIDAEEWQLAASLALKKKVKFNKINSWRDRQKISAYLFQRGYTSNTINAVIDEISD